MGKVKRFLSVLGVILFIAGCKGGGGDSSAPITFIISGPTNPTSQATASFNFAASESGCSFQCQLDSGAWEACVAPKNYTGLTAGSHTFSVQATDGDGNVEANPPSYTWVVDLVNPITTITAKPNNPTSQTTASFTFAANKAGCTFQCKLDAGEWTSCTSPKEYNGLGAALDGLDRENLLGLPPGSHTFSVKATDALGNVEAAPPTYTWVIDVTSPITTITLMPGNPTSNTTANFAFTANKAGCTFQCQLDGGAWTSCASPQVYNSLALGGHSFSVQATDPSGNVEVTPPVYLWVIIAEGWIATSEGANLPVGRYMHTAVWTGSEMIIWGGEVASMTNTGGRYNPSTDSWLPTSTSNAPSGVYFNSPGMWNGSAIWDGNEMIIWGGRDYWTGTYFNTGGRYNPSTDSWTATSINNAPSARSNHTAVWTGTEMIVWGGEAAPLYPSIYTTQYFDDGGRYDPLTDSWTPIYRNGPPLPRSMHTAVWTGTEMIVWGGWNWNLPTWPPPHPEMNDGGIYNLLTDTWRPMTTQNAPLARHQHTAVWTGTEMIIWGGVNIYASNSYVINTGGRYNPVTDSWQATANGPNEPSPRWSHTAVWTGKEMIIWGGTNGWYSGGIYFDNGAKYDPADDSWTPTTLINAPTGRYDHTAVWTGDAMIVWGGEYYDAYAPPFWYMLNSGGIYFP